MFDYEAFRLKLILHRRNFNLTQEELSELADLSDKNISKIELGKQIPKLKTAVALINAFNSTVTAFMGGETDNKKVLIDNVDKYLITMTDKEKKFILELSKGLNKEFE